MKLYTVKCTGMSKSASGARTAHGFAYVVAENSDEAYMKVREYLDKKGIGFRHERELSSVELFADTCEYPDCGVRLYL